MELLVSAPAFKVLFESPLRNKLRFRLPSHPTDNELPVILVLQSQALGSYPDTTLFSHVVVMDCLNPCLRDTLARQGDWNLFLEAGNIGTVLGKQFVRSRGIHPRL